MPVLFTAYLGCVPSQRIQVLPSLLIWGVNVISSVWDVKLINQSHIFTLYITLITSNASYKIPKIYLCGGMVSWGVGNQLLLLIYLFFFSNFQASLTISSIPSSAFQPSSFSALLASAKQVAISPGRLPTIS